MCADSPKIPINMINTSTKQRHKTFAMEVGGVMVGGGMPIVVQSMTNTDTPPTSRGPPGRWRRRRAPARSWCTSRSLPDIGERAIVPVFIDGTKATTLRGPMLTTEFKQMVIDYIEPRFGIGAKVAPSDVLEALGA